MTKLYYNLIATITFLKFCGTLKNTEPQIKDIAKHVEETLDYLIKEYEKIEIKNKISLETINYFVFHNKAHILIDYCLARLNEPPGYKNSSAYRYATEWLEKATKNKNNAK